MVRISSRLAPIAACVIALLMLLSGCGKQKYRSLDQLPKTNTFISHDASIQGSYTVLDGKACKNHLGANVLKKGYQPIYITLTNTSDRALYFSEANINLPTVPADIVAQSAHTHTAARAIGFGVPGAVGVCTAVSFITAAALCPPMAPFVFPPAIAGIFVCSAPAIISTKNSISKNEEIDINFEDKALRDQYLPPHTTINGLIFVPKKMFNPTFEIALADSMNRPLILASNPAQTTAVA